MPSLVPAPLADVAEHLRCPVCSRPLASAGGAVLCSRGHAYDIARHGYVTLAAPRRRRPAGDDAAMIAARAAIFDADCFAALTAALVDLAADAETRDAPVILDVGAGTGHHLAALLDALPGARGIALDVSKAALRAAVRRHPRIAAVAADVWQGIPLRTATVDLALNVFAPRNPAELARVLRPGARLAVVTPAPHHLHELAALHGVGIDPRKRGRLHAQLTPAFELAARRRIAWKLRLADRDADAVVRMGPAARHLTPAVERRLRRLPEALAVTAAVDLHVFRRRLAPRR